MLARAQGIGGQRVDEPEALDAALTRARDAQAAGEPDVLDVRITNVGPGADQSWYKASRLAHTEMSAMRESSARATNASSLLM